LSASVATDAEEQNTLDTLFIKHEGGKGAIDMRRTVFLLTLATVAAVLWFMISVKQVRTSQDNKSGQSPFFRCCIIGG